MTFVQGLLYFNFVILFILFSVHFYFRYGNRHKSEESMNEQSKSVNYLSDSAYKEAMDRLKLEAMVLQADSTEDQDSGKVKPFQDKPFEKSQSSVLETLIHYYRREASKEGILFTFTSTGLLTEEVIKQYQLIHLAGNLLQNGLEALNQSYGLLSRRLDLHIEVKQKELSIRMFNTYPEDQCKLADLELWTTSGFSTKGNEGRGNGLAIIKRLVKEHDGVLYLDTEHGITFIIEFDL